LWSGRIRTKIGKSSEACKCGSEIEIIKTEIGGKD
jgi:hypothetical protein